MSRLKFVKRAVLRVLQNMEKCVLVVKKNCINDKRKKDWNKYTDVILSEFLINATKFNSEKCKKLQK